MILLCQYWATIGTMLGYLIVIEIRSEGPLVGAVRDILGESLRGGALAKSQMAAIQICGIHQFLIKIMSYLNILHTFGSTLNLHTFLPAREN